MEFYKSVVGSKCFEFVWGCFEFVSSFFGDLFSDSFSESKVGVKSSSNSCTSLSELADLGELTLNSLDSVSDLLCVTSEFLAESERCGILGVGSSDFDDILELGRFLFEGCEEGFKSWDKNFVSLNNSSDVHNSWEGVIRRLTHVYVVVWVYLFVA